MARKKALGDDPLFINPTVSEETVLETEDTQIPENETVEFSEIVTNEKLEAVKRTISDMQHEVKKLEQRKRNREDDYQRMTFIIKRDILDKLRDYCYTERVSQKEGLERALVAFLGDKEELVAHPERPKQVHKRKINE